MTRTLLSALVLFIFAGTLFASEKQITAKELPPAVLAAFEATYPAAQITGAAEEMEDSVTCYEISSNDGGIIRDVLYMADGSIVEIEQMITIAELPEAIVNTIKTTYSGGTIEQAERKTRSGVTNYEVIVNTGDKFFEVALDEGGTVLETEEKTAKTEDADEDEE